ncbi:MAG: flagellar biosynthesis anti-sigma factor FlgM [Deltaproteobacteria bacterium]|nr:flagellar biosynthesis anti-sigma factor FlgM [Deltaproteobacteria bacterium]MBW2071779.1 flagellar biosynthesis anti-sigma factor FlgM [Deltaproteobacteria bacterium]
MKVEDSPHITEAALKNKKTASSRTTGSPTTEQQEAAVLTTDPARIEISSQSREAQKAADISKKAPDVRYDKVEALKARIAAGQYQVDSTRVADKILRDVLTELLQ